MSLRFRPQVQAVLWKKLGKRWFDLRASSNPVWLIFSHRQTIVGNGPSQPFYDIGAWRSMKLGTDTTGGEPTFAAPDERRRCADFDHF
tara:strand:+ start:36 stop:299 length:264 start_codon:yes stop_codon:yes gene_type:complete